MNAPVGAIFEGRHRYQMMRMTLLAKTTVGKALGERAIEDYRIVHLTHSQNQRINILHPDYVVLSPGLKQFTGRPLHEVWREILSPENGRSSSLDIGTTPSAFSGTTR